MNTQVRGVICGAAIGAIAIAGPVASGAARSAHSVARCATGQLRVRAHGYGEAGGQFRETVTLSNRSASGCEMSGWSRVTAVDAAGETERTRSVPVYQANVPRPSVPVVLPARGSASFDVYGADFDAVRDSVCARTARLLVVPPGDRAALSARVRLPACGHVSYEVSQVVAGGVDRRSWTTVVGGR